jgi:superfamily II DNA or RNA helicase
LIKQAAKHFKKAGPDLKVETVLGNPGPRNSTKRAITVHNWKRADVLVSTVQTLASASTMGVFPDPDVVIVDEAHRSMAPQYKKVLNALGLWSGTKGLGVTATPFREDHRQFEDVWQAVVANIDIAWLMSHCDDGNGGVRECDPGEGYLMVPTLQHLTVDGLDLSQVPTSRLNGSVDFRDKELAEVLEESGAFDMITQVIATELGNRKGVIFAPTVESSKFLADTLTRAGIGCHHIDGTMNSKTRDGLLADFGSGKVRWISNVNIVTEGFDVPDIDAVVLARPTQSRIFFRQAVGRALRPSPGKTDALILDIAGASDGMSLAGVESLTDVDTAIANAGESILELVKRSDRERQGRYDRVKSLATRAQEIQNRSERATEQMKLTAEGLADKLPGLTSFVERVPERHDKVLDFCTAAIDKFLAVSPESTLKDLSEAEEFCAEKARFAQDALGEVEDIRTGMRIALQALKDAPSGDVARAMATGHIGLVRGNLFGEEADRYLPPAPGDVQKLKTRSGKQPKTLSYMRQGWAQATFEGHLFCPLHEEAKDPSALIVAVRLGVDKFIPVKWHTVTQETEVLGNQMGEGDAYEAIVEYAADNTMAPTLLNPNSQWRRKPPSDGLGRYASSILQRKGEEVPDNATAGFCADVVNHNKYFRTVDALGKWVRENITGDEKTPGEVASKEPSMVG